MEGLFVDGLPARITKEDFRRYHLQTFPKFADAVYDAILEDAIEAVYAMFYGVATIWDIHPRDTWYAKTVLCYRLLTAWYLADMYPTLVAGIPVMGGIPIKRKKVDGVDITYRDEDATGSKEYQDLLGSLKSNPFGVKAYLMIRASGKRVLIYNQRYV
jgi:hypothetical protein